MPLIHASAYRPPTQFYPPPVPEEPATEGILARLLRRVRRVALGPAPPGSPPAEGTPEPETWPKVVKTPVREYRLYEQFMRPHPSDLCTISDEAVARLLETMDKYRTDEAPLAMAPPAPARQA